MEERLTEKDIELKAKIQNNIKKKELNQIDKRSMISLSINEDLKNRLKNCSEKKYITNSSLIRIAISEYLDRNERN